MINNQCFKGTRVVTDIELDDVYPLIDTNALFTRQWQFRRTAASEEAYQEILRQKAWPAFEEWKNRCRDDAILEPKVVYGYFTHADIEGVAGFLLSPPSSTCPPAVWRSGGSLREGETSGSVLPPQEIFPLQLVTVGSKVVQKCQWLFAAHKYVDYLYLHGLAAATAEALAEYWHRKILRELNVSFNAGKRLPAGSRISPGYKVWPNLSDQKEICQMLDAGRIGVSVTETYQLVPEYSTSAMIVL